MVDGRNGIRRDVAGQAPRRQRGAALGRRMLAALAAVAALALAAAAAAGAQPQQASAQPQWLLFSGHSGVLGVEQIFRITTAGTGLKQLTRGSAPSSAPAFSPDGTRVAFARIGAGILTMNPDGTGVRALTSNARDSFPAWSPDGRQIAFLRPSSKGWGVFVMSATGAGQRQLAQAPPSGRPSWTKGGLLIPTGGDLARIDVQTGRVQKLYGAFIDATAGVDTTVVAPDLSAIAFVGARDPDPGDKDCGEGYACPRFALFVQDIRSVSEPRLLVRDAGPAAYSPDGRSLAFVLRNQIVIRQVADGSSRTIKPGHAYPSVSTPPSWQPR